MKFRKYPVLGCLLATLSLPPVARPESLGRLFFTPEERRVLDERKRESPGGQRLTLDGKVSRSTGKDTHWINGTPAEGAPPTTGPGSERLKVGETLIPASGERHDLVAGGRIVIHRSPGR